MFYDYYFITDFRTHRWKSYFRGDHEVAVAYFRAGYTPNDYITENVSGKGTFSLFVSFLKSLLLIYHSNSLKTLNGTK